MHHWRPDMLELEYAQPQTTPQYNEILVRLYSQRSGNVLCLAPVTPDGDPPASKSAVLGGDSSTMCTSTFERVTRENDAIDTLTWLGSSFFSDIRLARFALESTTAETPNRFARSRPEIEANRAAGAETGIFAGRLRKKPRAGVGSGYAAGREGASPPGHDVPAEFTAARSPARVDADDVDDAIAG
ncbi:hypothetical protein BH23CHL4_BH23CHL4_10030 [soil metagenome]